MDAWIATQLARERIAQAHTDAQTRRLFRTVPRSNRLRLHAAECLMRFGRTMLVLGFRLSGVESREPI